MADPNGREEGKRAAGDKEDSVTEENPNDGAMGSRPDSVVIYSEMGIVIRISVEGGNIAPKIAMREESGSIVFEFSGEETGEDGDLDLGLDLHELGLDELDFDLDALNLEELHLEGMELGQLDLGELEREREEERGGEGRDDAPEGQEH